MREFSDVLYDLDDGEVVVQLTKELPRVVQAVMETGRAGALTLKLDLKREKTKVIVKASVATKIPSADVSASIFFAAENGNLTREDPRQLELREVAAKEPTKLRVAGGAKSNDVKED